MLRLPICIRTLIVLARVEHSSRYQVIHDGVKQVRRLSVDNNSFVREDFIGTNIVQVELWRTNSRDLPRCLREPAYPNPPTFLQHHLPESRFSATNHFNSIFMKIFQRSL